MTDNNFERRYARSEGTSFADDPHVQDLLARLDGLERSTDPRLPGGEVDKDAVALKALKIASELASYVSGWAMDHKIGLAIEGLGNIPDLAVMDRTPAYDELRETVNGHQHEAAAVRATELAHHVQRRALYNLLAVNIGGLPEILRAPLAESLEALDYGETLPLLKAEKDGKKRQLRELKLQLYALGCIEYLRVLGEAKYKLQLTAADAFGVSDSTVRGWEYRLRTEWDAFRVANVLSRAKRLGMLCRANGDLRFERFFGMSALKHYGSEYKSVQRSKQSA
jgi:hypothetical protein